LTAPTGPLCDVRVLDLTSVVMGPLATQILGDLGADVISVEDLAGDLSRSLGLGPHPQLSGVSLNLLRNKRNVSLDLKHPDGREAFLRLAETADIIVTNLRPGPLARLGLTYYEVRARKPDIIYCQAQGWPTDSPDGQKPAYDDVIQAASGIADLFLRRNGEALLVPSIVADKVSGLTIVYGVLAALHHRDRTGEGQRVEVPMVDAMRSFVLVEMGGGAMSVPPTGPAGYPRVLSPNRRPQRTADGWIHVLPYSAQNYVDLFCEGGRPELADDRIATAGSRGENADTLYCDVAAVLTGRTTADWIELCERLDIPASRVATLDELIDELPTAEHPVTGTYHVIPSGVRLDATPTSVRRHAPLVGEQSDEVLAEVGYSPDEVEAMRAAGAVRRR